MGVLQGLTEFLPVSSSAHLVIAQQWLHLSREGAFLMALDVALHVGTLGALIAYFYKDLGGMAMGLFKQRLPGLLIVGTIPAALIGILFKDFFSDLFAEILPASFFLLITGWILWLTKWVQSSDIDLNRIGFKQALLVGVVQAVAILPGISRSGSTIAMGLFLKLKPEAAVRFSFLLGIPAIAGAAAVEFKRLALMDISLLFPVVLGVLASFVVGYFSIRWMLKLVGRQKLHYFSWYCWGLGGIALVKELFF